jgi:N6-adenosine-specific RNA methylase IME4
MEFHEVANIFPMMSGEEFESLKADIQNNGLHEPIWTHDSKIIDGRNRYQACLAVHVEPRFREWDGNGSLVAFVVSLNLHRRHLNESQRGMVAARLANMQVGNATGSNQYQRNSVNWQNSTSRAQAAELLNVSERTVNAAKKIIEQGSPELIALCDSGQAAVRIVESIVNAPIETQQRVADLIETGEAKTTKEAIRKAKSETVVARQIAQPSGKYRVIYADPPWSYGNTQPDYHTEQRDHYPVMSLQEICDLPIKEIAEDDSVLFLWVTSPILEESFVVVKSRGLKYKATIIWDKVKHNMGHYNSVRHEIVLICTRGSCQPDVRKLFDSVITEERTAHSEKPSIMREIIDTIYPNGKRVELFARRLSPGWETWGLEVPNV